MEISKTPIPLDDEETIKRFTEEIHRRSIPLTSHNYRAQVLQPPASSSTLGQEIDNVDQVKNQSTQTEPVTITINIYPNRQKSTDLNGPAVENHTLDHAKLKNPALESVIAQSPHVSGVLAPPCTPETIPNYEISQMIADAIDDLPPEAFSSLGDSRFAPRRPLPPRTSTANRSSSIPKDPIYGGSNKQISPADRKSIDESFARMSFKAADSSPASSNGKFPETVFIDDVQGSKWADNPIKHTSSAPTNIRTTLVNSNPFSVLSENIDKKLEASVETSDSVRLGAEGSTFVKKMVRGQAYVPPHLRVLGKPSDHPMQPVFECENSVSRQVSPAFTPPLIEFNAAPPSEPASGLLEDKSLESGNAISLPVKPAFTPPLIDFNSAPPSKPASSSSKIASGLPKDGNLENELFFNTWPKLEKRSKPPAKIRKVILSGIPSPTPKLVASLVYGGALDFFYTRDKSAVVIFLHAEDCQKYYDDTPNGVQYRRDEKDCTAFVELGEEVDVIGGQLATYIEKGFTRCVRAIGVNPDIPLTRLWAKAENNHRRIEDIEDGKSATGLRSVVFRFCDIRYAVTFKLSLEREEEWDHCNVHFSPDPCQIATGPHF